MQNDTPITAKWSRSKQEVECEYGGRLYFETGSSYISAANWYISTKFGLLNADRHIVIKQQFFLHLYRYKCKKLQFIHKLTANDTSKTAKKSQKGDITNQHIA